MPEIRRIMFNPADRTQGYKLWSNGRVESIGLAPVVTPDQQFPDDWAVTNPVQDMQVISWSAPSGYILDNQGEIWTFGGVTDPGVWGTLPTYGFTIWRWFFMNPNGDGSGYRFAFNGTYDRWGPTAPVLPIGFDGTVPDYHQDFVRDVQLDWATKKWAILGKTGQVDASFQVTGSNVIFTTQFDVYRALVIRNWNLTQPKVLVGHMSGWLYTANSWGSFSGQPVEWGGRDVLADMFVINDGSGSSPMELAFASRSGGVYRWFVSSPPTAVWNSPVDGSTVTTTTRPSLTVGWSDPDGDSITGVDVRIFGPNGAAITDPNATVQVPRKIWLSDRGTTGFVSDFDLENGTWQAFVRVQDAAQDLSAWAKTAWTQNVTRPAAPTLSAPVKIGHAVRFSVSGTTNTSRFIWAEYSDDGGTTWFPVRDANPGPSIVATGRDIYDYEAPFNEERFYRARVASQAPSVSSLWSSTVSTEVNGQVWSLMDLESHTELNLSVQPGISKSDPAGTGVFVPLVGSESIVVGSGWREGDLPLKVQVLNKADRYALRDLIRSDKTYLLRNPLSDHWYVRVTDSAAREFLRAIPLIGEKAEIRDASVYTINFTVVGRPSA